MINRISAVLADADKIAIKTSISAAQQKLPFLITATKEEKGAKQNLGDSLDYVIKGINVVQNRPDILPVSFITTEYTKDVTLYQQLVDVRYNLLSLQQKLDDTMTILGQEMMAATNDVYGLLQLGAKKDASLKPLLDEMKTFYEKTKKKSSNPSSAKKA